MYEATIARIAVTSAAVIRMARLLLIALLVCSIGRLTTTAPARSPALVGTQCWPSPVGRIRWLSMWSRSRPALRPPSSWPWQSIRQLGLNVTAWMYWYSFLPGVIRVGPHRRAVGERVRLVARLAGLAERLLGGRDRRNRASVALLELVGSGLLLGVLRARTG